MMWLTILGAEGVAALGTAEVSAGVAAWARGSVSVGRTGLALGQRAAVGGYRNTMAIARATNTAVRAGAAKVGWAYGYYPLAFAAQYPRVTEWLHFGQTVYERHEDLIDYYIFEPAYHAVRNRVG